jgi:hypothetical protein
MNPSCLTIIPSLWNRLAIDNLKAWLTSARRVANPDQLTQPSPSAGGVVLSSAQG